MNSSFLVEMFNVIQWKIQEMVIRSRRDSVKIGMDFEKKNLLMIVVVADILYCG